MRLLGVKLGAALPISSGAVGSDCHPVPYQTLIFFGKRRTFLEVVKGVIGMTSLEILSNERFQVDPFLLVGPAMQLVPDVATVLLIGVRTKGANHLLFDLAR